jgi:hypothetical protein
MIFFMAFEAGLISFQFGRSIDNKDCDNQGVLLSLGSAANWLCFPVSLKTITRCFDKQHRA